MPIDLWAWDPDSGQSEPDFRNEGTVFGSIIQKSPGGDKGNTNSLSDCRRVCVLDIDLRGLNESRFEKCQNDNGTFNFLVKFDIHLLFTEELSFSLYFDGKIAK